MDTFLQDICTIGSNIPRNYILETYRINASAVPSGAVVLDTGSICIQHADMDWYTSTNWEAYNGVLHTVILDLIHSNQDPLTFDFVRLFYYD